MRKGTSEEVLRAGAQVLREREASEEMEAVLALFASFVMSPEQVRQIVRWEMAVLRESPWYQEIVQEGFLQGRQEGIREGRQEGIREGRREGIREGRQEGIQEGIRKGLIEAVLHLVQSRFELSDGVGEHLAQQLEKVHDVAVLHQLLTVAASTDSLDEFLAAAEGSAGPTDQEDGREDESGDRAQP